MRISINDPWRWGYLDAAASYFANPRRKIDLRNLNKEELNKLKGWLKHHAIHPNGAIKLIAGGFSLNYAIGKTERYFINDDISLRDERLAGLAINIILGKNRKLSDMDTGDKVLIRAGITSEPRSRSITKTLNTHRQFRGLNAREFIEEALRIRNVLTVLSEYLDEPTDEEVDARPEAEAIRYLKGLKNQEFKNEIDAKRREIRESLLLGRATYWTETMDEYGFSIGDLRMLMAQTTEDRQDVEQILKTIYGQDYEADFYKASDMGLLVAYSLERLFDGIEETKYRIDGLRYLIDDERFVSIGFKIMISAKKILEEYLQKLGTLKESDSLFKDPETLNEKTLSEVEIWGKIMYLSRKYLEVETDRVKAYNNFKEMLKYRIMAIDDLKETGETKESIIKEARKQGKYQEEEKKYLEKKKKEYLKVPSVTTVPKRLIEKWKKGFPDVFFEGEISYRGEHLQRLKKIGDEKKLKKAQPIETKGLWISGGVKIAIALGLSAIVYLTGDISGLSYAFSIGAALVAARGIFDWFMAIYIKRVLGKRAGPVAKYENGRILYLHKDKDVHTPFPKDSLVYNTSCPFRIGFLKSTAKFLAIGLISLHEKTHALGRGEPIAFMIPEIGILKRKRKIRIATDILTSEQLEILNQAAQKFNLSDADQMYLKQMWAQYLVRKAGLADKEPLKIITDPTILDSAQYDPSAHGNYVLASMLTDEQREKLLGAFEYVTLTQDPANAEVAKDVVVTLNSLDGGIGEAVGRLKFKQKMAEQLGMPIEGVHLTAKGTDLGYNVNYKGQDIFVNIAEAKLMQLVLMANKKTYSGMCFQPLVNWQSKKSYEDLFDTVCLYDRFDETRAQKRTYRQLLEESGIEILPMVEQADLPGIEEITGNVSLNPDPNARQP
ncbi:MAG: hypothetical protein HQ579_09005, partial [Candidatus Omnitrophica bacterium]|nr:hypothetical protein [Candidatus Omnitrophota bacterium]